jgi:hypothetical protein
MEHGGNPAPNPTDVGEEAKARTDVLNGGRVAGGCESRHPTPVHTPATSRENKSAISGGPQAETDGSNGGG